MGAVYSWTKPSSRLEVAQAASGNYVNELRNLVLDNDLILNII